MTLSADDEYFLRASIELSARSLHDEAFTPFGALIVVDGVEVGRGTSSVVHNHDPTAHAEVEALRDAGQRLGRHLMPDATLYCSGTPCPMCLVAAWWASVPRIVTAASLDDSAAVGFEDAGFFARLRGETRERDEIVEYAGPLLRAEAADVLRRWKNQTSEGPS